LSALGIDEVDLQNAWRLDGYSYDGGVAVWPKAVTPATANAAMSASAILRIVASVNAEADLKVRLYGQ
jgi:hypothetical protein